MTGLRLMGIHVFGLSGGIGCGKSTVAAHWVSRGLPVVDADQLAREVVAPGTQGLAAIVAIWGDAVLDADGALNRPAVASKVFGDAGAREQLNAITHPRIHALGASRISALEERGEPLACYDAALIVESGTAEMMRPLVIVTASRDAQIQRTAARDGLRVEDVAARIDAQMPVAEKAALADHVIDNSGTLNATQKAADAVLQQICASKGVDPRRYGLT